MAYPPDALLDKLAARLGPKGFTRDPAAMAPSLTDWRGRYHGAAAALLSPASARRSRRWSRSAPRPGAPLVPQGGNTSMVGGATPDASGDGLLLSTAADEPDPQPRRRRRDRGLRGRA